jgi:glycosyltransferase involved in cell wall biosynthesis
MKAPISVCMIVRNEAPHVEDTFKSIRPFVEEMCIVDTGSSDATPEIAQRYADKFEVFTACNNPESGLIDDFSMARQRSMSLATQPWRMWIDGDDVVLNAELLPQIVASFGDAPAAMAIFPYEYDHDHHGNCTCRFYRERVVRGGPGDFEWLGPVHEVLVPHNPATVKRSFDDVVIQHRRRTVKKVVERGRNLRILEAYNVKTGGKDPRTLHYLGLEYGWCGRLDDAIRCHQEYVGVSGWDEEKCLACLEIAKHYQQKGDPKNAIEWALKAITQREDWGEPYFALAKAYYDIAQRDGHRRDWERSVGFAKRYLDTPPTKTMLFTSPLDRAVEVHRFYNIALNWIGDVHGALQSVETALRTAPDDPNLRFNRAVYQNFIGKEAVKSTIDTLIAAGALLNENQKPITSEAGGFIKAIMDGKYQVAKRETVQQLVAQAPKQEAPRSGLDIVLYTGPAYESWSPATIAATGIGGSETMAWEMCKRLVALGHRVRHYGECQGNEGVFAGVEWIHYDKCRDLSCDVFITSRRPEIVDEQFNIRRKLTLAWIHDVHCGPGLTYERALKIDRFLCLTNWHRNYFLQTYPHVHPSQVLVTRNGVDLGLYAGDVERNPHKIVYSSSPDRGLQPALLAMPEIRKVIPDAELHIFYGWSNWEKTTDMGQQATIRRLKAMVEEHKEHGVVYRGRVAPGELAREQMSAGLFVLPSWFTETFCIGAAQAQAAGCRIVCTPIAALNETVGDRGTMIPGDWLSEEFRARYVEAVISHMQRADDSDRETLKRYARENFGLEELAADWHAMLYRLLAEVTRDVVVPYQAAS